ncbi:kinase-like domain-containing protein [Leptodontidium sp. 2 PMI_412]|nr:kinase-like domain-containing protein [Leptodontidium sp. 2 PMI_412]
MEIPFYFPDGVREFLAIGSNTFIGLVDKTTVCNYPQIADDESAIASLQVEATISEAIGPHDRIIGFQGRLGDGLLLEYTPHGSLARYVSENPTTEEQRLNWSRQDTEAVAVIHAKGVIHCDIKMPNLLLDSELNVKLCDFQGRLLGSEDQILSDGGSSVER